MKSAASGLLAVALVLLRSAAATASDSPTPVDVCTYCTTGGDAGDDGIHTTTTLPGSLGQAPSNSPASHPAAPLSGGAPAVPVGAPAPARPRTYYDIRPVCYASAGTDAACAAAYDCPDPGSYRALVYSGPTPQGPWTNTGQRICTTGSTPVGAPPVTARPPTDAELAARARQDTNHYPVDPPMLTINPSAPAIVQLPTILSTQHQAAYDQQQIELGVHETVRITPHWQWHLDDPSDPILDATTSGQPYDHTDPDTHPEHYLLHIWHTRGAKTVTLTVTWTATLTRHDTGTTITLPGATVKTAGSTIQVREGRAELTSP